VQVVELLRTPQRALHRLPLAFAHFDGTQVVKALLPVWYPLQRGLRLNALLARADGVAWLGPRDLFLSNTYFAHDGLLSHCLLLLLLLLLML